MSKESKSLETSTPTSRRHALQMIGGVGALTLFGCSSGDATSDDLAIDVERRRDAGTPGSPDTGAPHPGADAGAGSPADAGVHADAAVDTGTGATEAGAVDTGAAGGSWATGGTAVLDGKDYGDPFAGGVGSTCTVFKDMTLGPCHAKTVDRQDISEGQPGLPTRLEFLLLDSQCRPLPNATIEIWHCSVTGLYSGNDAVQMCTNGNAAALAARWFRGIRTSDAKGRVTFDTCFPGWYKGRTVHIHFTVVHAGNTTKTSQLFFDDALKDDIFTHQPDYAPRGIEDTSNTKDGIYKGSGMGTASCMSTKKEPDGALLAWKAIVIA